MYYFNSPDEIIKGVNAGLGYSKDKGNLLSLSDFRTRMPSCVEKFCRDFFGDEREVIQRGWFDLLKYNEIALFHFGKGKGSVGKLFLEQGYTSKGDSDIYEKVGIIGEDEWVFDKKVFPSFKIGFEGIQFIQDISRRDSSKAISLEEYFPNECFVKAQYLDKVNK